MNATDWNVTFYMVTWPMALWFIPVGTIGSIGNVFIITAQLQTPALRNYLTFGLAVSDLVCTLNFSILPVFMILQNILTYSVCMRAMASLICGLNSSTLLTAFVGIERLLVLLRPHWKATLTGPKIAVLYLILLIVPYSTLIVSVGFYFADDTVKTVICTPPIALKGPALLIWNRCTLAANSFVITIYVTLAAFFQRHFRRIQRRSTTWNEAHLITSSILVAALYATTWTTTMTLFFIVTTVFEATPLTFSYVAAAGALFAVTNNASNAFIYYMRSEEYRRAFRVIVYVTQRWSGHYQQHYISIWSKSDKTQCHLSRKESNSGGQCRISQVVPEPQKHIDDDPFGGVYVGPEENDDQLGDVEF